MRVLWILMIAALAASAGFAASLPTYEVKHTTGPITIDGVLGEPDWQQAPVIDFVFPWDQQTGAKQPTHARLLWDDTNLYVGYDCVDTDITAQYTERDDPTYKDDCVELFVNPAPGKSQMYYGLEMNCRGVLYDYFNAFPAALLSQVNLEGVQIKTKIRGTLNKRDDTDEGWTLEVAIPFAAFAELQPSYPPRPGVSWRINLNRWDGTGDHRRLSQWTPSGLKSPSPHNPESFGIITFVDTRTKKK